MKLAAYMRRHKLSQRAVARSLRVSQQTVQRYCNGRVPTPDVMERILAEFDGAVRPNDFFPDAAPATKRRRAAS